jgi:hypothetical protein
MTLASVFPGTAVLSRPVDHGHAVRIREAMVTAGENAASIAPASGLAAAVQRQLPSRGLSFDVLVDQALNAELAASDGDTPALGLAKACARQIKIQAGAGKASAAVERVRALVAGRNLAGRGARWRPPTAARVLGAARR